ncbi:hypothetical protein [uncultured Algibacter sp.]|uniref:hypothetical protein n=1 Tax=uncultured Algibacter sp. TaxID=298659 RepID=UPI00260606DF|nr:hypothetical protein [uncultured Algibacter sp.]
MKNINILMALILLSGTLIGCQEDDYEVGDIVAPTNIQITSSIVGADASNPNGDGSGMVNFSVTADNALSYQYMINGERIAAPQGNASFVFAELGVNTYTVTALAFGAGGITSSQSMQLDVLSTFEDQEAKDLLSGGTGFSKTWYWAADKAVNIGLGTNTPDIENRHTFPERFRSNPWHEDKLCMYDAEFVFSQITEGELLYEQTAGSAYTPGDFAATIGVDGESCHGEDVAPSLVGVKTVTMIPSSSVATIDGEYRGTTMSFSNDGFMSWYSGVSKFEIIKLTSSTLEVRVLDAAVTDNAWYCKFQTEKPVR